MSAVTKNIAPADAAVLIYTGAFGHPYCVTKDDGKGSRTCAGEANTQEMAIEWAKDGKDGRVFKKVRGGYRQVFPKVQP